MEGITALIPYGGLESLERSSTSRRTPPHPSNSLPRHKKQKLAHDGDEQRATASASFGGKPPFSRTKSGSDESASKWFEKANRRVPNAHHTSPQTTGDPPFFLSNQQEFLPEQLESSGTENAFGAGHEQDNENENEELRGVIDDLTVENKRLKRLLKSHRTIPTPTTEPKDKLFELRIHGLAPGKKGELEKLLRSFTAHLNNPSLSTSQSSAPDGSAGASRASTSLPPHSVLPLQHVPKLQPTDSGYASNSPSRGASVAVSSGGKSFAPISRSSRNTNIKNYLHDIPDALLPHQSPTMSERAKQILVVRRLEQLFTGQNAAPGDHSQPMQQQEVSHSAARAETRPGTARRVEGSREAHILPHDAKVNFDFATPQDPSPTKLQKMKSADSDDSGRTISTPSRPASPDQRPTRPLDLDIHRAQVALENIEYIRHLGLSTPHIQSGTEGKGDSWIYLNLLIGMAQLHTLNVTPAFVRKAIRKLSTKFILSPDGRQVRWTGGSDGSMLMPLEDGANLFSNPSLGDATDEQHAARSKRCKTSNSSNAMLSEEPSSDDRINSLQMNFLTNAKHSTSAMVNLLAPTFNAGSKSRSAFDYTPLVYKGKQYSAVASYLESSSGSSPSGNSGELVRQLSDSTLEQRRGSDEGTITFYNNPYFCRDASADRSLLEGVHRSQLTQREGLGFDRQVYSESPFRYHDACYFTPHFAPKPYDGPDKDVDLLWPISSISAAGECETQPIELQACGIGGVAPEDNFAMDVKVLRQVRHPGDETGSKVVSLTGNLKRKRYTYRTDDCEVLALRPSKLPPPSYIFYTSSSSSADHGMDTSGSDSSSSADEQFPAPAPFLNQWSTGSSDVCSDGEENEIDSVHQLELGSGVDPGRVAAQEQEYPRTQPGTMDGSLIATVGASQTSGSAGNRTVSSDDGLSEMSVEGDSGEGEDED